MGKWHEVYGQYWPAEQSLLSIELYAYRHGGLDGNRPVDHFKRAFDLTWPNFRWHTWVELQIDAWCRYKVTNVIGHTRASKTYTLAHILYLDYCANPLNTWTSICTVTFGGLKDRMWSDLMTAIGTASFQCPYKIVSTSNEAKIKHLWDSSKSDAENRNLERFQIDGFAVSNTKDAKGRIQGKHAEWRRVIADESQEVEEKCPEYFVAEVNAMSADDGGLGYRGARLANPVDQLSQFGKKCEPTGGWSTVSVDDLFWETGDGNICLHLDAYKCHNMVIFNKLERGEITEEKYKEDLLPFQPKGDYIKSVKEGTLEYWMYIRGFFPPEGLVNRVFNLDALKKSEEVYEFDYEPKRIAMLDPAYEADDCALQILEFGKDREGVVHVNGVESIDVLGTQRFDHKAGRPMTKDMSMAKEIIEICEEFGVEAKHMIMDRTGNGRSLWALLSSEWSHEVHGCDFYGAATDRPLLSTDETPCNDLFQWFTDELWFRAAYWILSGQVHGLSALDEKTIEDMGSRRYTLRGHKRVIESKKELKKRLGRSPDFGDAFCLFAELFARLGIFSGFQNYLGKSEDEDGNLIDAKRAFRDRAKKANELYLEDSMFSSGDYG